MNTSDNNLFSDLHEAFSRLKILESQRPYLDTYIKFLVEEMVPKLQNPYPTNFTNKPSTVLPELKELSSRTAELLSYLSTIHQSTIVVMTDPSARNDLELACEQMVRVAETTIKSLTKKSDSGKTKNTGGRPRKDRVLQLTTSLAGNYERLTGKPPTLVIESKTGCATAIGDFHRLLDDVFGIFKIDASPENFAKNAIKAHTVKTSPKS